MGKEFHPISELWSKFEKIMVASGIPNLYPQASTQPSTAQQGEGEAEVMGKENVYTTPGKKNKQEAGEEGEGIRFELGQTGLPPGVAPGGGRIYA